MYRYKPIKKKLVVINKFLMIKKKRMQQMRKFKMLKLSNKMTTIVPATAIQIMVAIIITGQVMKTETKLIDSEMKLIA